MKPLTNGCQEIMKCVSKWQSPAQVKRGRDEVNGGARSRYNHSRVNRFPAGNKSDDERGMKKTHLF